MPKGIGKDVDMADDGYKFDKNSKPAEAEMAKACEIQTRQNGGHLIDCECIVCLEWKAAVQSLQNIIDRQAEELRLVTLHKNALREANKMFVDYEKKAEEQIKAKDEALAAVIESCKRIREQNPILNMGFLPLQRLAEQSLKGGG